MQVKFFRSIDELPEQQWSLLDTGGMPFLDYKFLSYLEKFHCVGERLGWIPYHIAVYQGNTFCAFMPQYFKTNSYGELVFDWSWADAYERAGLEYYPKLVSAIPYTPVSGPRILFSKGVDHQKIQELICSAVVDQINERNLSSFHCLFPNEDEMTMWTEKGFLRRLGCQFHWRNREYETFDHYLDHFSSRKRKNIKRERKSVQQQGFHLQMLHGREIEPDLWPIIYELYQITFYKKSGIPTFTLAFFKSIAQALGDRFIVNLVSYKGKYVACAIFYRDEKGLYGRHWGCFEEFSNLHFEACYYQGLEYAIENKLELFEPGAQGEHKISRGFLPSKTWSVHWIRDPVFSGVIKDFVAKEEAYMNQYIDDMMQSSPFKSQICKN